MSAYDPRSGRTSWPTAPAPERQRRRRIGEVLVEQGILDEARLESLLALQSQAAPGQPRLKLGALVVEQGIASEREVAQALADALALPLVDLGRTMAQPEAVKLLPRAVAERAGVLVLSSDRDGARVTVATADPTNVVALDDVKLYTGAAELHVLVATASQVKDHLARSWSLSEDSDVSTLFEGIGAQEAEVEEVQLGGTESAPIVRLVDVVLADAVRARASDVHVEPQAGELRIRYRVDGLLRDVMTVPRNATSATVSRIKIVSGLDISERRRPQDGRAKLTVDGGTIDARVSTLPTLHGEKVVIRLLPRGENMPPLDECGMTPAQLELLATSLEQAQGLVLITGPTGSGKTNTLYAAIKEVSKPERNIVTLEDPVEVQLRGISQVQVSEKSGLTFAKGLRSILRQDPDIVLVGEVRDAETAELALQASLTGHLVLTTLHTNDAVAAVTRLVDMGVEPFLVASSLSLVVAQRLVRRPCAACAVPAEVPERVLSLLGLVPRDLEGATPMMGKGCSDCGGTGYRGRVGVYEVLPVTAEMRAVLLSTPTEAAIGASARAHGMLTLRASALLAASQGITTYEEVLRATHVDTVSGPRCPHCSRALADDMIACPYDGTPVGANRCRSCDKPLDAEWTTCPWCRTAVVEETPHPVRPLLPLTDESIVVAPPATDDPPTLVASEALASTDADPVASDPPLVDTNLPDANGAPVPTDTDPVANDAPLTDAGEAVAPHDTDPVANDAPPTDADPTDAVAPHDTDPVANDAPPTDTDPTDAVAPNDTDPVANDAPPTDTDPTDAGEAVAVSDTDVVMNDAPLAHTDPSDAREEPAVTDDERGGAPTLAAEQVGPSDPPIGSVPRARTPETTSVRVQVEQPVAGPLPRVLLVVADPGALAGLTEALSPVAELIIAVTADEAVNAVLSETFAAVVIEQSLEDMPGLELLQMLRSDESTLPLVLLDGDRAAALEAGATLHLSLPAHADVLLQELGPLLQRVDARV